MTRDEAVRERTVKRFLECEAKRAEARASALADGKSEDDARDIALEAVKAHWNAWAKDMLGKQETLEKSGAWTEKDFERIRQVVYWPEPSPDACAWIEEAKVDFSGCHFLTSRAEEGKTGEANKGELSNRSIVIDDLVVDMRGFVFPSEASFLRTTFSGPALFDEAAFWGKSGFQEATFSDGGSFYEALFMGDTFFTKTIFSGITRFSRGFEPLRGPYSGGRADRKSTIIRTLRGIFSFRRRSPSLAFPGGGETNFWGDAWFGGATFSDIAVFARCKFEKRADFRKVTFSDDTFFDHADFLGVAHFESATFSKRASFRYVNYEKEVADFTGIKVDRAFDLTGTRFSKMPRFSQSDFKQPPDLDGVNFPTPSAWPWRRGEPALVPMYRSMRRMAIQGADYEREQMAFKAELRSHRWTTDKLWHPGLWFGLLYDGISDCGRSIFRPMVIWLASVFAFAVLYVRMAEGAGSWGCGTPFIKSLFLSGRNALVLSGGGRDAQVMQAYECLFGLGAEGKPNIPDSVSFIESFVQVPLSAVLIFLFLLAVKNRFKIK